MLLHSYSATNQPNTTFLNKLKHSYSDYLRKNLSVMFRPHFRRGRDGIYGVFLLITQLFSSGYIPPITLALIIFQIAVFLDCIPMLSAWRIRELCLLPSVILKRREWFRLIAPVFMHADDMHLYYNMISFLWKGRRLEPYFGSKRFLLIMAMFTVATSSVTVALSYLFDVVLQMDNIAAMNQCAVGFSGVIFALKVLNNAYFPLVDENLFGWMPFSLKYACWAELFLIQFITPNASFVGHLAGIIVGLAYIWGPLEFITSFIDSCIPSSIGSRNRRSSRGNDQHYYGRSSSYEHQNFRNQPRHSYGWRISSDNYDDFTGGLSEEEQIRRATEESLRNTRSRRNEMPSAPYPP